MSEKEKEKQLSIAIVKGKVADFARTAAEIRGLTNAELATILREIADLA